MKYELLSVRISSEIFKAWKRYRKEKRVKHAPEIEKALIFYMTKKEPNNG